LHDRPDRDQNQMEEADTSNTVFSIRQVADTLPRRQSFASHVLLPRLMECLVSAAVERIGPRRESPFNISGPGVIVGQHRMVG
jgi:hypothetical protein